jgi:hypothetical protein
VETQVAAVGEGWCLPACTAAPHATASSAHRSAHIHVQDRQPNTAKRLQTQEACGVRRGLPGLSERQSSLPSKYF